MALKQRSEIATELTWNLSDIFADEATFERALADVKRQAEAFTAAHRGRLAEADESRLLAVLSEYEQLRIGMEKVSAFTQLDLAADFTNAASQKRMKAMQQALTPVFGDLTFLESELLQLADNTLEKLAESRFGAYINRLRRMKAHRFSAETERILAGHSMLQELPYQVYETAKLGDLTFPDFTVNGDTHPLSYSLYETVYAESPDSDVRRAAHDAFYDTIATQRQTMALVYFTETAAQKAVADLRGFASVFDMLLLPQEVTRDLYDRQIDVLMRELAPVMRRYAEKLKNNYGLDRLTYADLRLPASPVHDRTVTVADAWQLVHDALAVMGEDYQAVVRQAEKERWVDFAQNIGKSTGGFCLSLHDLHSYILLNWNGGISEVFTLAHELGHAVQGKLAAEHNSVLQEDPSLYFVEAPSTLHELLLTNHLLAKNSDPESVRRVAGHMVGKTYFHNCVTHLLEAAFQREVYRTVEAGGSLSADDFDSLYLNVLRQFWGDAVELPASAGRTWMRQPHYYMGLYPYTYSAGLTVATAVSARIRTEGQAAVSDWIETLKLGGSVAPLELAKRAGVDLSTEAPLRTMIGVIAELVDLI